MFGRTWYRRRGLVELHRVGRKPELGAVRCSDLLQVAVRDRLGVVVHLERRLERRPDALQRAEPLAPFVVRPCPEHFTKHLDALPSVLVARRRVLEARVLEEIRAFEMRAAIGPVQVGPAETLVEDPAIARQADE